MTLSGTMICELMLSAFNTQLVLDHIEVLLAWTWLAFWFKLSVRLLTCSQTSTILCIQLHQSFLEICIGMLV